ncbi:hypothetical protein JCM16358_00690 [Halanaerocella petrolearia]
MQLTAKEEELILDNLAAEEICIHKYEMYANNASDKQIKGLFNNLANQERKHAQALTDMLDGDFQSVKQGGQQGQTEQMQSVSDLAMTDKQNNMEIANSAMATKNDQDYDSFSDRQLLQDALMTEKHVSTSYDNAVLESANRKIVQNLEHIQQEEHNHAQQLFEMMNQKGWYTVSPSQ